MWRSIVPRHGLETPEHRQKRLAVDRLPNQGVVVNGSAFHGREQYRRVRLEPPKVADRDDIVSLMAVDIENEDISLALTREVERILARPRAETSPALLREQLLEPESHLIIAIEDEDRKRRRAADRRTWRMVHAPDKAASFRASIHSGHAYKTVDSYTSELRVRRRDPLERRPEADPVHGRAPVRRAYAQLLHDVLPLRALYSAASAIPGRAQMAASVRATASGPSSSRWSAAFFGRE